nr:hypothetical protein [Halobacterium noricense]
MTFGCAGGVFALLFLFAAPVGDFLAGRAFSPPSGLLWLFVVGGLLGGGLLAQLLWGRLGGARSPRRGAAVGGLVGLLALPVPFYVLELAYLAVRGNPFEGESGASPIVQALTDLLSFIFVPLFLGALGALVTFGSTVVVGALVGYVLARD